MPRPIDIRTRPASDRTASDPLETRPTERWADSGWTSLGSLAALLLMPWGLRLALLATSQGAQDGLPIRGFLADLVLAWVAMPALSLVRRQSRWLTVIAVLGWCIAHAANDEHIRALGAMASLDNVHYLADPTFLAGSALALFRPVVIGLAMASCAVVVARVPSVSIVPVSIAPRRRYWMVALVLLLTLSIWPTHSRSAQWPQRNFVLAALAEVVVPAPGSPPPGLLAEAGVDHRALARGAPDLRGDPRIPLGHPRTNVLLIILEGLSGGHLPSVAQSSGLSPLVSLDGLDALATAEHHVFSRFVAQQRQTSRGQYALLCGDAPAFSGRRTRMADVAMGEADAPCLPNALTAMGYRTVYLQAAPLAFQRKDQFMPKAGFGRVLGADSFGTQLDRTPWGVDDATLFARAADLVDELERGREPWFLALLTVGTHHPFLVPGAPKEHNTERAFARAVEFVDHAVSKFLAVLDHRGVSDRTLIIITSDESSGLGLRAGHEAVRQSHAATEALHQAWGLLSIRTPDGGAARVDEPFAQSDLALSVLDYLGQPSSAFPFAGRSVFRRYRTPRSIPFANTYLRRTGAFIGDQELVLCDRLVQGCEAHALDGGFGRLAARAMALDPDHVGWLRAAVDTPSRLVVATTDRAPRWWSPLFKDGFQDGSLSIAEDAEGPEAMAEGRFRFAAHSRVEVTIDATFSGADSATFLHRLRLPGNGTYRVEFPFLVDGDRLILRYVVHTADVSSLQAVATAVVTAERATGATLVFRQADALLRPSSGPPLEAVAVHLETAHIERAGQVLDVGAAFVRSGHRDGHGARAPLLYSEGRSSVPTGSVP